MLHKKGPFSLLTPPGKIPESFPVKCWKTSRSFTSIQNTQQIECDIFSNICTNKLVKPLRLFLGSLNHNFWLYFITDSCVCFPHWETVILVFLVTRSYSWSFLPAPACQIPPLKRCPLKTHSQVVLTPLTTQSWGWTAFLCACVASVELSSPGSRWHWSTSQSDLLQDTLQSQWDHV